VQNPIVCERLSRKVEIITHVPYKTILAPCSVSFKTSCTERPFMLNFLKTIPTCVFGLQDDIMTFCYADSGCNQPSLPISFGSDNTRSLGWDHLFGIVVDGDDPGPEWLGWATLARIRVKIFSQDPLAAQRSENIKLRDPFAVIIHGDKRFDKVSLNIPVTRKLDIEGLASL
jgi:hypothetical protein